jgi:hypothetical protein
MWPENLQYRSIGPGVLWRGALFPLAMNTSGKTKRNFSADITKDTNEFRVIIPGQHLQ